MLDYRRAFRPGLVLAAVLALLSPALPALADPANPTPAEITAAQRRVDAARQSISSLQARAGQAAEAYLGAQVQAQRAGASRDAAVAVARTAQDRYIDARLEATRTQGEADLATAQATAAEAASTAAAHEAEASQDTLDLIAVGAFRTGGQLGLISQLMLADDPMALVQTGELMNQVGDYQRRVIEDMQHSHQAAQVAAKAAVAAQRQALSAANRAAAGLAVATAAKEQALGTSRIAVERAAEAKQALAKAGAARLTAQRLVAQADRQLGRAVLSVAALKRAAGAAKRQAGSAPPPGKAPSTAADTAIKRAFGQIGVPYSWGGGDENGPTRGFAQGANTVGFDCSGLTLFAYAKAGVRLDHYSQSQWDHGKRVPNRADIQPGDLLFFAYDTSQPSTIHHVGLYIGDGKMIEAPYTGEVVRVAKASRSDYIGATRPWAAQS